MSSSLEVAVLRCDACGAPVPLSDEVATRCFACGVALQLSGTHRALRDRSREARAARQQAERRYREVFEHAMPRWSLRVNEAVIAAVVIAVPALMAASSQSFGPRVWVVCGGLLPFAVTFFPWPILWLRASPRAYLSALGETLHSAPRSAGEPLGCGACGAPLALEPEALAATCDYCLADTWIGDARATEGRTRAGAHRERSRRNLAAIMATVGFRRLDMWAYVVSSLVVWGLVLGVLWLVLPAEV